MSGIGIQPQRVPIGTVSINGRDYPVSIRLEWYRVLQRLAGQVDTPSSSNPDPGGGGGSNDGGVNDDSAIDLDYGLGQSVRVLAMALESGLQALESDSELPRLRAEVARLAARIGDMEQGP